MRERIISAPLGAALVAGLFAASGRSAAQLRPSPSECDTQHGNLVVNCGFEAGTTTGWSVSVPPGAFAQIAELPTSAHSGRYLARFSGFDSSTVIQMVPTIPGARYTFAFYLVSLGIGGEPSNTSFFEAFFGGEPVFLLDGQGPLFDAGYTRYSFVGAAAGSTTEIRFLTRNVPAAYDLDDVSVIAADVVPEPATAVLVGGGLLVLGAGVRRWRATPD